MPTDAAYYQQLKEAVEDLNDSIGGLRKELVRDANVEIDRRLVEIRAAFAPLDVRLARIERVLFGTSEEGSVGLIAQLKENGEKLDTMAKEGQQRTWLMRGALIGLGLNLAQSTGLLPALLKAFIP